MKKLLFLTAAALGIASQAFALNPTNSFYVPKKGNFLFRGDASWQRTQDKTGTDTATSLDGMYGITNGIALIGGVYENPVMFDERGEYARIPEVGIRFVPCLDKGIRLAAEGAYGFGSYGSDDNQYDYIRTKLTGGIDVGNFIFGAFFDYAHYYRFQKGVQIHNANYYGGGLVGTYNVNDKTSVDLTYRHSFKDSVRLQTYGAIKLKSHYKDAVKLSTTYEFKDGAYVTPYVGYNWVDKGISDYWSPRNTTTFGVNVAVEF